MHYKEQLIFYGMVLKMDGTLKNIQVVLLVQLAYSNIVAAVELKLKGELEMIKQQIKMPQMPLGML